MFKGNLGDLFRQAQQMGESIKNKQEELAKQVFDVSVGGDMVRMTFNGKGEALSVVIDPLALNPSEQQMLQDLVQVAVNEGVRRSQQIQREEMTKIADGLNIPGVTQ
ncbi:MAG: YbaB/EbfC family nucleoid-associated protein [Deltaproteobacteria bacterium]|nr:YbaB/EbfC family nucleoid-associated protein [Deltaproteobacteria bacterium]